MSEETPVKRARTEAASSDAALPLRQLVTEQHLRRCEDMGISKAQLDGATAAFQLENLDALRACVQQVVAMHGGMYTKGGSGSGGGGGKAGGSSPSITLWLYREMLQADAPGDQLPFCGVAVDEMDCTSSVMTCLHCTLTVAGMLYMAEGRGGRQLINGRSCRQVSVMVNAAALAAALSKVAACSVPLFLVQDAELRVVSVMPGSAQVTVDSIKQLDVAGHADSTREKGLDFEAKYHAVPKSIVFDHVITMPFDALSKFLKEASASQATEMSLVARKVSDSKQVLDLRFEHSGGSARRLYPMLVATPLCPGVTARYGELQTARSVHEACVTGAKPVAAREDAAAKVRAANAAVIAAINGVRASQGLAAAALPDDADAAKHYADLCREMGVDSAAQHLNVNELADPGDAGKVLSEAELAALPVTAKVRFNVIGLGRLLKCISCPVVSLRTSRNPTTPTELTYVADGKTLFFNIISQLVDEEEEEAAFK